MLFLVVYESLLPCRSGCRGVRANCRIVGYVNRSWGAVSRVKVVPINRVAALDARTPGAGRR